MWGLHLRISAGVGVTWSPGKVAGDLRGLKLCPAQEVGGGGHFGNNSKADKEEIPSDPTLALYLPPLVHHSHTHIMAPCQPLSPASASDWVPPLLKLPWLLTTPGLAFETLLLVPPPWVPSHCFPCPLSQECFSLCLHINSYTSFKISFIACHLF